MNIDPAAIAEVRKIACAVHASLGCATLALEGIESRVASPHADQRATALREADQLELSMIEARNQLEDLAAQVAQVNHRLRISLLPAP